MIASIAAAATATATARKNEVRWYTTFMFAVLVVLSVVFFFWSKFVCLFVCLFVLSIDVCLCLCVCV